MNGQIEIRTLSSTDATPQVVSDIQHLLMKQHGDAEKLTKQRLQDCIKRSKVVGAFLDGRIVGIGVLVFVRDQLLSHDFAFVGNLEARVHRLETMKKIHDELEKNLHGVPYIDAHALPRDKEMREVLRASGYRRRKKLWFRKKVKGWVRPKKRK